MIVSPLSRLLDLVSPRQCSACGRRLALTEDFLCGGCLLNLPLTDHHLTPYDNSLARLLWGRLTVEKAFVLMTYEPHSDLAQIFYDLKYHGMYSYGQSLGEMMGLRLMQSDFLADIDCIVAMPVTWRRRLSRGYNQSMMIARGLSHKTGLPIEEGTVKRVSFAGSQTKVAFSERSNMSPDVFQVSHPERLEGRHVLLIDDVVTTGATLVACGTKILQSCNARLSVAAAGFSNLRAQG